MTGHRGSDVGHVIKVLTYYGGPNVMHANEHLKEIKEDLMFNNGKVLKVKVGRMSRNIQSFRDEKPLGKGNHSQLRLIRY